MLGWFVWLGVEDEGSAVPQGVFEQGGSSGGDVETGLGGAFDHGDRFGDGSGGDVAWVLVVVDAAGVEWDGLVCDSGQFDGEVGGPGVDG